MDRVERDKPEEEEEEEEESQQLLLRAPTDYGNFLVGEGQLFPVFAGKTNTR